MHSSIQDYTSRTRILPQDEPPIAARVLKKNSFNRGEKLLIVPFTAGTGVEATSNLNRLSLMIVKGMDETLKKNHAPFEVLGSQDADQADLILQGHITQETESGIFKRWLFRKREAMVAVEGEVIEKRTGDLVLRFSHQRKTDLKSEWEITLAEGIGEDIGVFLMNCALQRF